MSRVSSAVNAECVRSRGHVVLVAWRAEYAHLERSATEQVRDAAQPEAHDRVVQRANLRAAVQRALRQLEQLTGQHRVATQHDDDLLSRHVRLPAQRHQLEHDTGQQRRFVLLRLK